MPSKTTAQFARESKARQKRAYHMITEVAMAAGFMKHVRDTAGFEDFFKAATDGDIQIIVAEPEAETVS